MMAMLRILSMTTEPARRAAPRSGAKEARNMVEQVARVNRGHYLYAKQLQRTALELSALKLNLEA